MYVRVLDVMHVCLQPFVLHLDRLASVGIYLHLIMEFSPDPRLRAKAATKSRRMQADQIAAQMNCAAMLASNMSASVVSPEPSFISSRGMKAYPKYPPSTAPTVASCRTEPRSPHTPQRPTMASCPAEPRSPQTPSDAPVRSQLIAALHKFVGQSPTPRPSTTGDLVAPWKRGIAAVDVAPAWGKPKGSIEPSLQEPVGSSMPSTSSGQESEHTSTWHTSTWQDRGWQDRGGDVLGGSEEGSGQGGWQWSSHSGGWEWRRSDGNEVHLDLATLRVGVAGGRIRDGASGGRDPEYYKLYYRAKGRGKAAIEDFVRAHGPPPSRGGKAYHRRKGE